MKSKNNATKHMIKNVVFISFDSLRSDYIAKANSNETPFFCLMRDQGAFFKNAIVQAPFTVPSHFSMLTGLYPAKTGVRDMHDQISPNVSTIFSILKIEGFSTISSTRTRMLRNRGLESIAEHVPFRYGKLAKAITRLNGKRFFAFLHYWDTHTPYETRLPGLKPGHILLNALRPVDKFKDIRFLRRVLLNARRLRVKKIRVMMEEGNGRILTAIKKGYEDAIIRADKFVGRVLRLLEEASVTDETLLVLTGDHGDSFNEHDEIHRVVNKHYEHGQFLYDNVLKVPLMLFWPKKKFVRVFDDQVQQIDVVPTILEALNIDYDDDLDGRSLWGVCTGEMQNLETEFAFSEVVRERWGVERRCVRSPSSKLIRDYKNNTYELYDLRIDAEEKNNLWPGDGYDEKTALMAELEAFSKIDGDVEAAYSESEQRQIEKTLRDLGYVD